MPEKISNEQQHERIWCAFTHTRVAWFFVVFCGLEVFLSWKYLDKPPSRPNLVEIPFHILVVTVYAPIFWMVLRCFAERFVIAIAAVHTAITVVSWFLPTLLNPVAGLFRRAFLVLWGLAFLMSLNMPIQSVRHPYIELEKIETKAGNQRLLIIGALCAIALVLGALLYFIPLR
jgi:FlaA1/EpsC-like NDP-sugar epimerase